MDSFLNGRLGASVPSVIRLVSWLVLFLKVEFVRALEFHPVLLTLTLGVLKLRLPQWLLVEVNDLLKLHNILKELSVVQAALLLHYHLLTDLLMSVLRLRAFRDSGLDNGRLLLFLNDFIFLNLGVLD